MAVTTPTPHITAKKGDFAKTVLMPGDPLRSKFIAETFLEDKELVNNVRGIQGYTGFYKGTRVSVMASGMGMPSMGLYSYELFSGYGVENIIRIGSAGALKGGIHVRDLVIGMNACYDTNYAKQYNLPGTFSAGCDYTLLTTMVEIAKKSGFKYHVGSIVSSDVYYSADESVNDKWASMGVLAVEMEAAALYMNAAYLGKRAICLCTCSNHIFTGEELPAEERQTSFEEMMKVALETAVEMENY